MSEEDFRRVGQREGTRTVGELLQAFKGHFELKGVRKGRRVVQNRHVNDVYERHCSLMPADLLPTLFRAIFAPLAYKASITTTTTADSDQC